MAVASRVDSQKINFGQIRNVLIPDLPDEHQAEVERQYLEMADCHDRAMAIKERVLEVSGVESGQYGQNINALAEEKPGYTSAMREAKARLDHLVTQLVAVVDGHQVQLSAFSPVN
jgi:hypothetical protein